jgi:hypothetical protein
MKHAKPGKRCWFCALRPGPHPIDPLMARLFAAVRFAVGGKR